MGIVLLGGGVANFELLEFLAFELKNKAFAHFGSRLFCCCVYCAPCDFNLSRLND
ncbi:hypothetical protein SynA1544_00227 [Synechococcus sp. A15-44]|nr:hypothetical protein SynA1544_00227 [Synechococcus sp. A15-44]